jgi:Mrp family chromosome partitioning ATPase
MSKYARVLERISASVSNSVARAAEAVTPNPISTPVENTSQRPTSTVLPRTGTRRQELERLRGSVLLANQMQDVQMILICGAREDDGATAISVDLALTLAELDRTPVALVDVYQGGPGVKPYLNSALPGRRLKEILPQGSNLTVQQTQVRNFYLIGDEQDGVPLMSLIQPADILRRLRERFKYVIVNAAPIIAHPDTALLATKVDGVIMIAQADKSRLDELSAAKEEFERVNANIMGVVLSRRKEHLPKVLADRV